MYTHTAFFTCRKSNRHGGSTICRYLDPFSSAGLEPLSEFGELRCMFEDALHETRSRGQVHSHPSGPCTPRPPLFSTCV
jgi:hypothetical protein